MLISDLSYRETVTDPSVVFGGIGRTESRINPRTNPDNSGSSNDPFVVETIERDGVASIRISINSIISVGGEEKKSDGGRRSISVVVGD
ncbi:hypothetical protein cce_2676 [Crocosphaera subtropica ATCC 51142]|uniref:Uncharacterized protein n=1 Tax=Crocosphaera subtropica (strain ATCC 51142 / BH68) TaxID=43989 RepID=B1WTA2_CROS5|nr:hypothetical protein [Crocosphaera subtropica]ACB52024.1 hypothetical protein cce_2676 [Crocosphaera subtropica ATCC 51142]